MAQPALQSISALPSDVLLGTGYLYEGNTHFGISRGGLEFNPNTERRNIPYDGKMSNVQRLHWDTFSAPTIAGTFIQFINKLSHFEPGSVSSSGSAPVTTLYTPKASGALYAADDYIENLRWVFSRLSGGFVQYRFPLAFVQTYTVKSADREEATIQATFEGVLSLTDAASSNAGKKPYVIELLSAFS